MMEDALVQTRKFHHPRIPSLQINLFPFQINLFHPFFTVGCCDRCDLRTAQRAARAAFDRSPAGKIDRAFTMCFDDSAEGDRGGATRRVVKPVLGVSEGSFEKRKKQTSWCWV